MQLVRLRGLHLRELRPRRLRDGCTTTTTSSPSGRPPTFFASVASGTSATQSCTLRAHQRVALARSELGSDAQLIDATEVAFADALDHPVRTIQALPAVATPNAADSNIKALRTTS